MNFQKSGEFSKIWRIFKNLENFQKSGEFSKIWRIFKKSDL